MIILSLVLLVPVCCGAQVSEQGWPKIGLVLSGGGARGVAHVGVIKALDEMRIPVDVIAGTSMGAIVGGMYASGMNAAELEQIILEADWATWLSDRPPRAERSYRRKADDFGFLVDFDLGLNTQGLVLPKGIVQGQNFTMTLRRWLLPVATVRDFDRLPIPFRAVATNLLDGREVVLANGDLPAAIRASMSAPGVFNPVRLQGQLLVDGSVSDNLPVAIAQSMGAEVLIVVDVGFPLVGESALQSALDVTNQMLTIMVRSRAEEQKDLMGPNDVLITPDLGLMGSQSFGQSERAMRAGYRSAQAAAALLKRYALSASDYAAYRRSVRELQPASPIIHRVVVHNESRLSSQVIEARLVDQRGAALDLDQLEANIADIYGLETFETVDYTLLQDQSQGELRIASTAKSWGPNQLRFGINLEDDFDGNSSYNLGARLTRTEMNELGGELRADLVLGERPELSTEFYQPLDYASRWFVSPRVSYQRSNQNLFEAEAEIAQFRAEDLAFSLGLGRVLSNWGELRLTLAHSKSEGEVRIGDPMLNRTASDLTNLSMAFGYDTIDRVAIPRYGSIVQLTWSGYRDQLGGDLNADLTQMVYLKPTTWGKNTILNWWELGTLSNTDAESINAFSLGGLFSLSGLGRNELQGDHFGIGRVLYYRRLADKYTPAFETPMYIGASVEVGNVWQHRREASFSNTLAAGSVFVVFDTLLGPLYLAYGTTQGGRRSAYLFLGQTF